MDLKTIITTKIENKDFSKSCITCPECSRSLKLFPAKYIEIDHCTYCNSFWLDKTELSTLLSITVDIPSRALTSR
ncbi:MAG: zf-TFIIB domain-containing protein [Lentisphaeraceae bacterium]|nr:zf-TFIIB domain-containing protein [Lentisphaeraceae bacterium]